jgi:hypothetical protein
VGLPTFNQLYSLAQAGPYSGNLATYSAFLRSQSASLAPYAP